MNLSQEQWSFFEREGYVKLGKVLDDNTLANLQRRIDEIMLGKANHVDYSKIMMQLDSESGNYDDIGPQTKGFKKSTLNYRKIEQLEFDPVFLEVMQRDYIRQACTNLYGEDTRISCFRAMFMNKPAGKGTLLPMHQDRWNTLDRDPLLTVYMALDPATKANGCVQIIPRSHKVGVINPEHNSGFLTDEQTEQHCDPDKAIYMELEAGEVALLHNYTLHGSDKNHSDISRRAFSVCLMDADTRDINTQELRSTSVIFGDGALNPETVSYKKSA